MEDRKKRLKLQRDKILQAKKDKREDKLHEFKEKTSNKNELANELLALDKKVKAKELEKDALVAEIANMDSPERDKRLAMY